jgi:hypothetical protein
MAVVYPGSCISVSIVFIKLRNLKAKLRINRKNHRLHSINEKNINLSVIDIEKFIRYFAQIELLTIISTM